MKKLLLQSALLLGLLGTHAFAGIVYSETVDGDFPIINGTTPLTTLNLTSGTNTITGRHARVGTEPSDTDAFAFVVPGGATLSAASVQFTVTGVVTGLSWQFLQGSDLPLQGTLLETLTSSSTSFSAVPQPAGLYQLTQYVLVSVGEYAVDYTFTLEVTPDAPGSGVPEPGSIVLFGSGLAALAWRRLR